MDVENMSFEERIARIKELKALEVPTAAESDELMAAVATTILENMSSKDMYDFVHERLVRDYSEDTGVLNDEVDAILWPES